MSEARRVLPGYVWIAILACVGVNLATMFAAVADLRWLGFALLYDAAHITALGTVVVAALRLRTSVSGIAANGLTAAAWCLVGALGMRVIELAAASRHADLFETFVYLRWLLRLVAMVGLVVAAKRAPRLAIGGAALVLLHVLPPPVWTAIYRTLQQHGTGVYVMNPIIQAVVASVTEIGLLLLLLGAVAGSRTLEPRLAREGLLLASRGVWFRVIASLVAMAMTWMSFAGARTETWTYLVMALAIVEVVAFAMFGIGCLQASDADLDTLPRGLTAVAGVTALWCGAVTYAKLGWMWRVMAGESSSEWLDMLTIVQPIAMIVSSLLLVAAIAGYAQARGDADLANKARSGGVAFAVLVLFAVLLTTVFGVTRSASTTAMFAVVGALCGLAAQVILARTCAAASESIETGPTIPRARVL